MADFARDLAAFVEKVGIAPCDYVGASLGARNGIAYAGDRSDHLKHFVCLDYGPEMSVASARNQIYRHEQAPARIPQHRRVRGHPAPGHPRPGADYYRNQAEHGLRLNYAGKYVAKSDPDMFWINGSFGVREVPYLWEQWGKIACPIMEMKGGESDFLSDEIKARMIEAQPSMTWVDVPDSGHGITGDNPDFLINELRAFFVD